MFLMLQSHVVPPLPWLHTVGSCLTASALCCQAADLRLDLSEQNYTITLMAHDTKNFVGALVQCRAIAFV